MSKKTWHGLRDRMTRLGARGIAIPAELGVAAEAPPDDILDAPPPRGVPTGSPTGSAALSQVHPKSTNAVNASPCGTDMHPGDPRNVLGSRDRFVHQPPTRLIVADVDRVPKHGAVLRFSQSTDAFLGLLGGQSFDSAP
jgi:hypothetical protein